MGDKPPIRIGLIGCGSIAASAHLPAIARLPQLVRLVATADVNLEAATQAAAEAGAEAYSDYRQVVERPDIDMVLLATPEYLHREQVEAAAVNGKHVLCEKPMAPSLADADRMIGACASAGVRLMVAHSRRFTRRYQAVREAIDRGDIGEVMMVRENERRSRPLPGEEGYYWRAGHWTSDPAVSVGAILTNGIHETDLLRWFAGAEPVAVYAEHSTTIEGNQVPDFITLTVKFANGALGSAEVSNCWPAGYPSYHQLELYGTSGMIRSRDSEQQGLIRFRPGAADFPGSYHRLLHVQDAYTTELGLFVRALRDDLPVPLPASEARAALRLGLAAVASAKSGMPVTLGAQSSPQDQGGAGQ